MKEKYLKNKSRLSEITKRLEALKVKALEADLKLKAISRKLENLKKIKNI